MARNQKRGSIELRWQRLLAVIALVTGIAGLTVGYVVQRRAHDELGIQIKSVEQDLRWIQGRLTEGSVQLERCRSRPALLSRAAELGITLVDIVPSQRVTVPLLLEPQLAEVTAESPATPTRLVVPKTLAATVGGGSKRSTR